MTSSPSPLPTYTLALPRIFVPRRATPRPARPPAAAPTRTQGPAPTPTASGPYPVSFDIPDIQGHHQLQALGCEAAAAVDWAAYFGLQLSEYDFQKELPLSDNPEKGFVGDVSGAWGQIPPHDYGVHAQPVADLLRAHGLPARAVREYTLEQAKAEMAAGRPVIVWVIGNVGRGEAETYTDQQGSQVTVAAYEHVVILTGYDETTGKVTYLNNGRSYYTSEEFFLDSWAVLGNMAIIKE